MTAPLDLDALSAALAKDKSAALSRVRLAYDHLAGHESMSGMFKLSDICVLLDMIAEITTLRETVRAERRRATDAEYMRDAYRQMLGPKGKKVADMWQAEGLVRIHTSWGPSAALLDGEGIAEAHLRMNEAAKDATPIDDIDGEIEQQTHAEFVRTALNPEGAAS